MNIVDSSLWIEHLANTAAGRVVSGVIRNIDTLIVPTVVIYEVYKKLLYEKSVKDAIYTAGQMAHGKVTGFNRRLSMYAAQVSKDHKLSVADSIIYATTLQYKGILWTQDEHFNGLPSVNYFPKPKIPDN